MDKIYDLTLKHPSRIIVFGPSGSGKTTLIEKLLLFSKDVFGQNFENIFYVSGQSFASIDSVNGVKINKLSELNEDVIDSLNVNQRNLLIFDDNIYLTNDRLMSDIFTKISHHKNLTVILLLQNLFPRTKFSRDISINSNYIILMANPRETTQIKRLSQQIDGSNFIYECFKNETRNKPYSYLLLDFDQDTPEFLRIRSNIFPGEEMVTYVKKEK